MQIGNKDTTLDLQGRYCHEGEWNEFSGSIVVRADGIIAGENLSDCDANGASKQFDIDGFLVSWNGRPVMIFLKRYPDGSISYCQIHRKDKDGSLDGEWEGNWAASLNDKAKDLLDKVLSGSESIDQVEKDLQSGGNNQPFIKMRDTMIMIGQASRKTQGGWTVRIVLSLSD